MAKQPVTVTLSEPVKFGSETVSELVIKPPKGKHLRGLSESPTVGDLLTLAEKLSGHPREVIDELDAGDAIRVVEAVSSFFEGQAPPSTKT